ncbi:hypothetical protein N9O61_03320 [Octadecabacter sp.]|nr:hypothetical protein [Octadecabacter sp.]
MDRLPDSITAELQAANKRSARRKNRLRVEANGQSLPVVRMLTEGFIVEQGSEKRLRGLVDLYDGGRHVSQCLIVAASQEGDLMRYDFKRNTSATDGAPLDFVRDENAPIALLAR